jgi:3'(2'), 5'-bisphosphate nucleotidase
MSTHEVIFAVRSHRLADAALAARLAARAGTLLVRVRADAAAAGLDAEAIGRRGDLAANELIIAGLAEARPGACVLSEESPDDPTRLDASQVWIVDPLDGTHQYALPGRTDWAVHIALWEATPAAITAAAVALPALGLVLATEPPPLVEPGGGDGPVRVVVSDRRPPRWLAALEEAFPRPIEVTPMGSAGAKTMAVVRGDADAYLHDGGQYEWDSAAPVAVAVAAGLHASRLDGSPLRYNRPDPYLPDLVVARSDLAGALLGALAESRSAP